MAKSEINPTAGRIVLYVPEPESVEASNYAKEVPAMVVQAFGGTDDLCNLRVFPDADEVTLKRSVKYDPEGSPRSWHWPPRA